MAPEPLLRAGTCDGSQSTVPQQREDTRSSFAPQHIPSWPPHSPSSASLPGLQINGTKLPRTVFTNRIILLLRSKAPACLHGEKGPAGTAASPPHHSTQDCSPRRILSLLDNLHVASLLHILSCSSDMVPVSTHGIQAFKIFHKLKQLYISTLSMISKPTGSARRAFHKISSEVMVALHEAE